MKHRRLLHFPQPGFTLIACLLLLMLVMLAALGITTLSSIQLRRSGLELSRAEARANARMALIQAIGQLQVNLGPDRRVSAQADITGDKLDQPFWTGVWSAVPDQGDDWLIRDDTRGGLSDRRSTRSQKPEAVAWLVSGEGNPADGPEGPKVALVSKEKTAGSPLEVSTLPILDRGKKLKGHLAWWSGDLGIRANLQVPDAHADEKIMAGIPRKDAYARVILSQRADEGSMNDGRDIPAERRSRIASDATTGTAMQKPGWSTEHFFDQTTWSAGVLTDLNHGGLKRDLTAYLESGGFIPSLHGLSGLNDGDLLAGVEPAGSASGRLSETAPRFGLLRRWAQSPAPFAGGQMKSIAPAINGSANQEESQKRALANQQPTLLYGDRAPDLQPILAEATIYTQMGSYMADSTPFIRTLLYPRVMLWNPYNVKLTTSKSAIMIQVSSRQEMWFEDAEANSTQWVSFRGGRNTGSVPAARVASTSTDDPFAGSYYFSIPVTTFGPGECLVFSPKDIRAYNGQRGIIDLTTNELSCKVNPDPSRGFYIDDTTPLPSVPVRFWYEPFLSNEQERKRGGNQADDFRAILKQLPERDQPLTYEEFDKLPQLCLLSGSLQYGAGKEPRISWNSHERMPMELMARDRPRPTLIPNVRTRESIRMRWLREHPSNLLGSGALSGSPHFEDALLANWNPRAAYIVRSPWENIAGTLPVTGTSSGPWFFGAYTRDLFDQAVSWEDMTPVLSQSGTYLGNPFGQPQEGHNQVVLFDLPRTETGVLSLGQLQHVKLSQFVWQPSYAIGNSLADPRLGQQNLNHTTPIPSSREEQRASGFNKEVIGWSEDPERSKEPEDWAKNGVAILQRAPSSDDISFDLSYEVNRTLWDRYYLSTGSKAEKRDFLEKPDQARLPNGRLKLAPGPKPTEEDLSSFHTSAFHFLVDGAFNVNSTRVEAWKAMLASTRRSGFSTARGTPFPRVLNPPGEAWTGQAGEEEPWNGYRVLSDKEIDRLAHEIVKQVKLRGPFLSMADFVNRRLSRDETGRMGALQAAIDSSEVNATLEADYALNNRTAIGDYRHPDHITDATRLDQTLKPSSKAWGIPGFLTQADVLQVLGSTLSARSDTFVIRSYGDSVDATGTVLARAWCEAVVQRIPAPIRPDKSGINPEGADKKGDLGRRFELVSFRWLSQDEL